LSVKRFAFQPWHSAVEFRRYLRKYLHEVHQLGSSPSPNTLDRTRYSQYESIILPVISFLKREGVDFRFNDKVVDIMTYPDSDPTTVSEIKMMSGDDGQEEFLVTVDPVDLVIVTLGSVSSGSVLGSNTRAPEMVLPLQEEDSDWSLWQKLADKSTKFGNPSNFSTRGSASTLETFTITLHDDDTEFINRLVELTHDKPGTEPFMTLNDSNWILTLSVPHQPIFANQPEKVQVIWGYALRPERQGNVVRKPMVSCTGEEIMTELLNHLGFPVQSIQSNSITIPCVMPCATAPFLARERRDRPEVIPRDTTNLGLVGQFVEIPDETTGGMEYSIRGAQTAVFSLMGLDREPTRVRKSHTVEFLDLLT
jgi:oleate hydratase